MVLEALIGSSGSLGSIGMVAGIGAVGLASFGVMRFSSFFQGAFDTKMNFGAGSEDAGAATQQPLLKIFYQFDHRDIEDWLGWILSQDKAIQKLAAEQLANYLRGPMKELGSVTEEAIKALIAFRDPDAYCILLELINNSIAQFGQFKSIEMYFPTATKGLIKLEEEAGYKVLKEHIQALGADAQTSTLVNAMIIAIGTIKNPQVELLDFFASIILNRDYHASIRETALKQVRSIENDLEKYNVHLDIITGFLELAILNFNEDDHKTLELLFLDLKDYIAKANEEMWCLLLQCCEKESTRTIFIRLVSEYASSLNNGLNQKQILDMININEPALSEFKKALAQRFNLSFQEEALISSPFDNKDIQFEKKICTIEKSKKTKTVLNNFIIEYQALEQIVTTSLAEKAKKGGAVTFKAITGEAEDEKLYLLRIAAANQQLSFIYIDMIKILDSNEELNELKNKINNCKPCMIYVDKVLEFLLNNLSTTAAKNYRKFFSILNEANIVPSVGLFMNLNVEMSELRGNEQLKGILAQGTRGRYDLMINIGKPNEDIRKSILNEQLSKIGKSKFEETFSLEAILEATQLCSRIEFFQYLTKYFEICLLVHGSLIPPKELEACQEAIQEGNKEETILLKTP